MITALASTPLALHGMGPWGYGPHLGFPWFALVIPLFWLAVIVIVVSLGRRRWRRAAAFRAQNGFGAGWGGLGGGFGPGHGGWGVGGTGAAEQTLADRFARGDIDEVEYRARLDVLRAPRPGGPTA